MASIPPDDPAVYNMICAADTVGVFQIESRAQMSMLPRLRPRCYYDLVIEVSIVRPGPIQGQMVHPYLRRRNGEEAVTFPDEGVRRVLGKTLGVPLFQEQAMSLAVVAAGFTPGEADQLRRAIGAWKSRGNRLVEFGTRIIDGMIARGYERHFAEQVFTQIKGFSGYGFPESHAASFALLVYASAWLKCHHPAAFAAALLNSQPMGFYAPAQIVRDAEEHGVEVRAVDVRWSGWECGLEEAAPCAPCAASAASAAGERSGRRPALRLGLCMVRGLREEEGRRIEAAVRGEGPFASVAALRRAAGVGIGALRALARADAFGSMGLARQHAIWETAALRDDALPLFDGAPAPCSSSSPAPLPAPSPLASVSRDYAATGLSLRAHPISFVREALARRGAVPGALLRDEARMPTGTRVAVAGLVLVRQRPSTANGVVFMTIEDESGAANLIVRPAVWERCRRAARHSTAILAHGRVERKGEVVHVLVRRIEAVEIGAALDAHARDFH